MQELSLDYPQKKSELYPLLCAQLRALCDGERFMISNLANASALLWQAMPDLNWAGFYLTRDAQKPFLQLGPFQGKTACLRIPFGRGVCGTAAAEKAPQLVADVHAFPGHIACDSASNSELVIPICDDSGNVLGVLDMDSPSLSRFDEEDLQGLLPFVAILAEACDWNTI